MEGVCVHMGGSLLKKNVVEEIRPHRLLAHLRVQRFDQIVENKAWPHMMLVD
jgi:hypothetical protein